MPSFVPEKDVLSGRDKPSIQALKTTNSSSAGGQLSRPGKPLQYSPKMATCGVLYADQDVIPDAEKDEEVHELIEGICLAQLNPVYTVRPETWQPQKGNS